jgi:hypothetical protein
MGHGVDHLGTREKRRRLIGDELLLGEQKPPGVDLGASLAEQFRSEALVDARHVLPDDAGEVGRDL